MKNIIKYILIFVIGGLVLSSCDKDSAWDELTKEYDEASEFYIQFLNATGVFETDLVESVAQDISTIVGVKVLGPPPSSDITVNLSLDGESTVTSNMYQLEGTSITIPAGGTSGSVPITFLADEMPEDEVLHFKLNMELSGGEKAPTAGQLDYSVYRVPWCVLEDLNDIAGAWEGTDDGGYAERAVTAVDGDNVTISGVGEGWLANFWGEPTTARTPAIITFNPDGTLVIDEQPYVTTVWDGAPYDYSILGTGTWNLCRKIMTITYDMHNTTDGYYLSELGYAPITVDLAMP